MGIQAIPHVSLAHQAVTTNALHHPYFHDHAFAKINLNQLRSINAGKRTNFRLSAYTAVIPIAYCQNVPCLIIVPLAIQLGR